ncbi:MAG: hypothetical protein EZS28_019739 [Streblomastix strix]|uniref:Uncharacterized protein n=1 Tax=Streblomastix strix TaxID=222440 RepID=A0A5J4VR50_9EUKA|nr:MAG: hypothetical protein EZS28_019739 [Streblomastix strix]
MDYTLYVLNAVPETAINYYKEGKITMKMINYSIAAATLTYTILLFPLMFIISKYDNLKVFLVLAAYSTLLSCILRLIPTIFSSQLKYSFIYIIISSVIIKTGSMFSLSTPSKLSALWFSSNERVLSTSLSAISPIIGVAFCFIFSPLLAKIRWGYSKVEEFHGNMPLLLYSDLILQLILTVLMTFTFQSKPPRPPSYSDQQKAGIVSSLDTASAVVGAILLPILQKLKCLKQKNNARTGIRPMEWHI